MTTQIIAVEPLNNTPPHTDTVRAALTAWRDELKSRTDGYPGKPGWYGVGPRVLRVRPSVPHGAFDVDGYLLDAQAELPITYTAKVVLPEAANATPYVQRTGDHRHAPNTAYALQIADALGIGANGVVHA